MKSVKLFLAASALCLAWGAVAQEKSPKYEMRAGWMASVANINWPAKKGLTVEELKKGYIAYLDSLAAVNGNAVVMQVRPTGDSFYPAPSNRGASDLTVNRARALAHVGPHGLHGGRSPQTRDGIPRLAESLSHRPSSRIPLYLPIAMRSVGIRNGS